MTTESDNIVYNRLALFTDEQCNSNDMKKSLELPIEITDVLCKLNPLEFADVVVYKSGSKSKLLTIDSKLLGAGAFGTVSPGKLYNYDNSVKGGAELQSTTDITFRLPDKGLDVAVKRIIKKLTPNEKLNVKSEICILDQFKSSCTMNTDLICFYDTFILNNEMYIITELAKGKPLEEFIYDNIYTIGDTTHI